LSRQLGPCIKFDLKAFDDDLHRALTGISNRRAARRFAERPDLPLVVASMLLVPGYVDAQQVAKIAAFIASIDVRIHCVLLAFAPNFYMTDLPCTTAAHAREAAAATRGVGLEDMRIGNRHLLGLGWIGGEHGIL
jgi:pyruvate formate lyase activating enzyme